MMKQMVLAALFAVVIWSMKWIIFGIQVPVGDGPMYLAMANGAEGSPPWSYHILTPRLAGLISKRNPVAGFFGIAAFSFVLTSVAIVAMLGARPFVMAPRERLLGAALFMVVYPGVAMFRAYFLTDSLGYALLAVACASVMHRNDGLLMLTTLLGIFNRETAFFVVPVWLAMNARASNLGRILRKSALVFSPAVIGYLLLHHSTLILRNLPGTFNYFKYETVRILWLSNISWLGTKSVLKGLCICIFLSYGPLWFLSIYGYYISLTSSCSQMRRPLLALGSLLLPTGLSLLVVDWRRGFQPLFPAVLASAVLGIRAITTNLSGACWFLAACGTVLAANFTTEAWWSRKISTSIAIPMLLWISLMVYITSRKIVRYPYAARGNI